jgi:hypothetical protein
MRKVLLFTLLFMTTASFSQVRCYDFSKKYDRFLKFGVGKTLIPVKDMDGRVGTTVFIEGELPTHAMGLHANIRTGSNYIRFYSNDLPLSIDTRYTFVKNSGKNLQYGGYVQVNTTGIWVDGVVTGGVVRLKHELNKFGFFIEGSLPVYGHHRKVISTNSSVHTNTWFDSVNKDFKAIYPIGRTRSTEYRITLATYFKLNYY